MSHPLQSAVVLASLLFVPYSSSAQSSISAADVKSFEGTWALDLGRSATNAPERRVITASSEWLRVETQRAEDDRPPVLIYKFDGSNNVNPYGTGTATSRLRRDGQTLVTETVFTIHEQPITVNEVLLLNGDRSEMTVETTLRVEHGYQGNRPALESGPPNVSKATNVFRRQPAETAR